MKTFKYLLPVLALFFISSTAFAQSEKSSRPSPPATAMNSVGDLKITVDYSRPSVKDRNIWGELVPYDKVWRTGANEATTIEFSKDVMIGGKSLKAGKYALFTIPGEKEWIVILNSENNQWGAYKYNKEKDAMRFTVVPTRVGTKSEMLKFNVSEKGIVSMQWDMLKFEFEVSAKAAAQE